MDKKLSILILEDVATDAELVERELRREKLKFSSKRVKTKKDFIKALSDYAPDLILADYALPQFDGLSALRLSKKLAPSVPFILVSGTVGEELAIESLKSGATDYVLKQRLSRLGPVVRRASHEAGERDKRKRAENELQASEEKYRKLVDNSPVGIYKTNLKGDILYVNEALARIYEFESPEEMMRDGVLVRYKNKKDRVVLLENLKRKGKVDNFEIEVITKKRSTKKVILNSILNGEELSGMIMDITERIQAENILKDHERKLRTVIEHSNEIFFIHDTEHGLVYVSPQARMIFGYTSEEMMVKWTTLVTDNPINEEGFRITEKAIETGERQPPYLLEVRRKDGEPRIVEIDESPIKDENGKVVGISGALRDVTEGKKAEEGLKLFRTLIDQSNDAIEVLDPKTGRFLDVNEKGCQDLGYSREEFLSLSVFDIDGMIDQSTFTNATEELRKSGALMWEGIHRRKDGSTFPVEVNIKYARLDRDYIVTVVRDITERRRAEKEIRVFSDAVSGAIDALAITDMNGIITYANPAMENMYGYEKGEFIGKSVSILNSRPETVNELLSILIKKGSWHGEVEQTKKNKEIFPALLSLSTIRDDKGNPMAMMGAVRDITERKRAEKALQESEELLKETGRIAKVGGWEFDAVTMEGTWTEEIARIHELDPHKKTNVEIGLSFYSGEARKKIKAAIKQAIVSGKSYDLELEFITAKGNRKWVRTIGHPIKEGGKIVRVRGSFQDITEQKMAGEAIRESEEKYRTLFEGSNDAISLSDLDGKFIDINRAGVELYGYDSKEEVLKINIAQDLYLNPKDRQQLQNVLQRDGYVKDWEAELKKKNGQHLNVLISANVIRDDNEKIIGYRAIVRDVTDKKMLEQQLTQAQKMEAIGTLAGGIAHDFNNILGAILGYTELTQYLVDGSDPKIKDNLKQIYNAGLRAKDLVQQILTFSRQAKFELHPLGLEMVIKEAMKLLRASIPASINIIKNIDDKCGYVKADATQMHQVIMNLCTNAYHAMREKGTGTLNISLIPIKIGKKRPVDHPNIPEGNYLKLSVSDTGHGIDPETLKRIFDPFFTTKGSGQGTGLGLSVVHGIIKEYKGAITVMSKPGQGSTFNIYLPKIEQSLVYESEADQPILKGTENILLVDDEQVLVHTGKQILENIGYKVTGIADSLDALEMFRKDPDKFDLVITDLAMPKMRGIELAKKMLEIQPDIPIILVTGYSESLSRESVQEMGLFDLIIKPVLTQDFGTIVRDALESKIKVEENSIHGILNEP